MNIKYLLFVCIVLNLIIACSNTDNNNTPVDLINGKVKKVTSIGSSTSITDFFYNVNGNIDSLVYIDTANHLNYTMRYFYNNNNFVSKRYTNGAIIDLDSTVYYTSANRLDSIVNFVSGSRLLKTFKYSSNGDLIYYKDYSSNLNPEPTYTNYVNSDLVNTTYTYNSGATFYSDTVNYKYSININNLTPQAFGYNFNMFSVSGFTYISDSKHLFSEINQYIKSSVVPYPPTFTSKITTTFNYNFDTQNKVTKEIRNRAFYNIQGDLILTQEINNYFEYY